MPTFLNHSFLEGIATRPADAEVLGLLLHVRQRTQENALVHPSISTTETGHGAFVSWANHARGSPQAALAEFLLHMLGGPWLNGEPVAEPVSPAIDHLSPWLQESVRCLLGLAGDFRGIASPAPTGGLDEPGYRCTAAQVENWRSRADVDATITRIGRRRDTLEVLNDVANQVPGLTVLESARRSARAWPRDCEAEVLHRALLGLSHYAAELAHRRPDGTRPSREEAAAQYQRASRIEMSRETGDVSRRPSRRRARTFVAGRHGEQFFDMHAKPGERTRVHIWVYIDDDDAHAQPEIYIGHCGEHLE